MRGVRLPRSIVTRTALLGAAVLAVVVAVAAVRIVALDDLRTASAKSNHSEQVLKQSAFVERLVIDLQTGERGFLLSRETWFLEPWQHARAGLPDALGRLVRLVADNPAQQARARAIDRAVRSYLVAYSAPIVAAALGGTLGVDGATRRVAEGKRRVDALRSQFDRFNGVEEELRAVRMKTARQSDETAVVLSFVGPGIMIALIVGLVAFLSLMITRPVAVVAAAARRMADGDLASRAPHGGAGEIGDLGVAFNELAVAVERSQAALVAERSALHTILMSSPLAIVAYDLDRRVISWNAAATVIFGWSSEEVIGALPTFIPPGSYAAARAAWRRTLAGERTVQADLEFVRRDGSTIEARSWSSALLGEDGRPVGVVSLMEDVGVQHRAEREVNRIFELCSDLVSVVGLDGYFRRVNPAFGRILGHTDETLLAASVADFVHPDDREYSAVLRRESESGESRHGMELRLRRADGSYRWFSWSSVPVLDEQVVYSIGRDITDAKLLADELAASRDEALRATEAKSEFLSRMSHELRTPLNAILGFGQLLELDGGGEPRVTESVEQILKAGRHLLELINEVLDIAKIEAGRLSLSLEPVHTATAVAAAIDLMAPLATERGILMLHEPADAAQPHVVADRQRLTQILLNLLSNAIKYSPEGGTIAVGCEVTRSGRVRLYVRDNGPGIASGLLARLFVPFDRLDENDPDLPGTGLGLALSRGLATAMGGQLGVDSTPGEGSTFWVEVAAAADPVATYTEAPYESATDVVHQVRASTILYIEDNLSSLRLVERILGDGSDVRLLSAMQGRLGLELARDHLPDIVLLDLHLPDIPGREVLRRLRQTPQTADIPVVILSADATPGQIDRLLAEGANAYLAKPIDVKQFICVLERLGTSRGAG